MASGEKKPTNVEIHLHLQVGLRVCFKEKESDVKPALLAAGKLRQAGRRYLMRIHLPSGAETSADPILEILKENKTIAVVGLSSNPRRPSHEVSEYMQSVGYRIIPVNPNETEVLGEKAYARLEDVPEKIEIVDVFRRVEEVPAVAESAIRVGAKVLWMQLGIENEAAAERARAAGLVVVEDACMFVEHRTRKGEVSRKYEEKG